MASHASTASMSSDRRATLVVLIVATVVALACAFGPIWMVRAGVLVALVGAAAAVWFAFREMRSMELIHKSELKAVREAAASAASQHHRESMELIATFTQRYKAHGEQLAALRAELSSRQAELSTLRGNLASAQAEGERRQGRILELQDEVALANSQLAALEATIVEFETSNDQVIAIPRRMVSSRAHSVPTAAELWEDGNHPTMVDLARLNLPVLDQRKHA